MYDHKSLAELRSQLADINSKITELEKMLRRDYFAEFQIEGRDHRETSDATGRRQAFTNPNLLHFSETQFEMQSLGLWNDMCRKFLSDLKQLLEIRQMEVLEEIDNRRAA